MSDLATSGHTGTIKQDSLYTDHNRANGMSHGRGPYIKNYNTTAGHNANNGMAFLTQGMQGMALPENGYSAASRTHSVSTPSHAYAALTQGMPAPYWGNNNGVLLNGHQALAGTQQASNMYALNHAPYFTRNYGHGFDNSPMSHAWTPNASGEVPTLVTPRRESLSSIENDTPSTPTFPAFHAMAQGGVAILNRSPSGTYIQSTPSPLQMLAHYGMPVSKVPDQEAIEPRLKMLVTREPAIPMAIPAPSSPLKALDRALENTRGETNVYIRGLMPETSDEMLAQWGRRFGDIKSSKSIIDHNTRRCKGFGFVRYHSYQDAEDCIRGFHHLGYEVSFARESFYSKLKAIADDSNTNLYVSNLPKSMNEHELGSLFAPLKVCSARILRTSNGTGRGVGFARFENRHDCEEVIRTFNNKTITSHGEDHIIQIRYADTQEQKSLKQTTAAARQFRSDEYEYATRVHREIWPANVGSPLSNQMGSPESQMPVKNEFKSFLGQNTGFVHRPQNYSDPTDWRPAAHRSPLSVVSASTANVPRTTMSVNSTPVAKGKVVDDNQDGGVNLHNENTATVHPRLDVSPTRGGSAAEK